MDLTKTITKRVKELQKKTDVKIIHVWKGYEDIIDWDCLEVYDDRNDDTFLSFGYGVDLLPLELITGYKNGIPISHTRITTDLFHINEDDVRTLAKELGYLCRLYQNRLYLYKNSKECYKDSVDPIGLVGLIQWLLSTHPEWIQQKREEEKRLYRELLNPIF